VQIEALLEAATQLDQDPHSRIRHRLPLIATLVFAGVRANELAALRWRDLDLQEGRIDIRASKTKAGLREISMFPALRCLLLEHRGSADRGAPEGLVFATRAGRGRNKDNVRSSILAPTIRRADQLLVARAERPLPEGLSPHKLRHTFASILVACGEDPASVMYQLGHTDPKFTLRVYVHTMRRDPREHMRLKALVRGIE
jgi:integrase